MMPKICAVGMLVAIVGALLSEFGWRGKRVFGTLCAVILAIGLMDGIGSIFGDISAVASESGVGEISKVALKIVGVGYVFGFCSDTAKELGEGTVASILTIGGRIEMLLLTMPYFLEILKLGMELVK